MHAKRVTVFATKTTRGCRVHARSASSASASKSRGARCSAARLSQNATLPGSHLNRTVYSGRAISSKRRSSRCLLSRGEIVGPDGKPADKGRHDVPAGSRWGAVHPFTPDLPRLLLYDLWTDPYATKAVGDAHPELVTKIGRAHV